MLALPLGFYAAISYRYSSGQSLHYSCEEKLQNSTGSIPGLFVLSGVLGKEEKRESKRERKARKARREEGGKKRQDPSVHKGDETVTITKSKHY